LIAGFALAVGKEPAPVWRLNGNSSDQNSTTVLDRTADLEGRLRFTGTLILNGKVRGEISSSGTLVAGETAEVDGEVRVGTAIVNGHINGNIVAGQRVELRVGAHVEGDITTPALVLEEGVVFDGNCKMMRGEIAAEQKSS
jgi:cytoskeletal protein CcmA (bactofilin family)